MSSNQTTHGNKDWSGSKHVRNTETLAELTVSQWNSRNIFPGFKTLQLSQEVKSLLLRLNETPENFTGRIIFMSIFNDISWGSRDNEKVRVKCSICKEIWKWSFLGPGSEKKWYSISVQIVHKVNRTEWQRR